MTPAEDTVDWIFHTAGWYGDVAPQRGRVRPPEDRSRHLVHHERYSEAKLAMPPAPSGT